MQYCSGMPARLLRPSLSLLTLLLELRYTLSRLAANALTSGFAPRFQALRDRWSTVQAQEIALNEELSDAKAQVDIADAGLDDFAIRFSSALQIVTGQKRDAPLYDHFFKKPLGEFRRPVLTTQLKAMEDWLLLLQNTPHTSLADMRPELVTLVEAGKAAAARRDSLTLQIRSFREVGERRQLFDQVNAERRELYGALGKLALSTPGLASAFPNQFFKPGESDDTPEDTVDSVKGEILALQEQLAERQERLVELEQEAEAEARAAGDKAQKAARLAELKQEIDARQREAQALADELK
jgi:hypothetical protein